MKASSPEALAALAALEERRNAANENAFRVADDMIAGVRTRGDAFVAEQIARFDRVNIGPDAIGIDVREVTIDRSLAEALDVAIDRVEAFHLAQLPSSYMWQNVIHRVRPLRRVGVYVPGGRAVYVSTLIMCTVPARIAGVPEIVVATTPLAAQKDELHYVCKRLGIRTIYQCGGAAGIAALALGTESLERVDKIVGPGNAYVTAAKARLVGEVGIDMTAGPTELIVIADETVDAALVQADLDAQQEHGPDSAVICISVGKPLAVRATLNLVADSMDEAIVVADRIAPEHLCIHARNASAIAERAQNAGAIYCGASSPPAAGDYVVGSNHVLPTSGSARFFSPLGTYDFVKRTNVIALDDATLQEIGPAAARIARFEGLPQHAASVEARSGGQAILPGPRSTMDRQDCLSSTRGARATVAAMTAYTLELVQAEVKLNQNESPGDFPFKEEALARITSRAWNRYPDFESTTLRTALADAHRYDADNILVGNGSNELLAAAIGAFVGPGTPVVFARPTFALYEKLVTIAGGLPVPVSLDPRTGFLPLDEMVNVLTGLRGAVVIVCSPNNPTGGVLENDGIDRLLATGATVLYDRAYGDFANDSLPLLDDRLVTFSTFSKAWGLAALRVGWLVSTAATCRQIRKVKLPYSLNIVSENVAVVALENRDVRDANVAGTIAERERVFAAMQKLGIEAFPSQANFIAFRSPISFDEFVARGVLIRKYADFLRVSIGTREENDRFLECLA